MDATKPLSRAERKGVVLVLVLAMLGLLAIIGVSFATFSGQARYSARLFSQKLATPKPDDVLEYGLSQLINDSTNGLSSMYGHGMKRDLYGNDTENAGYLDRVTLPSGAVAAPTVVGNPIALSTFPRQWTINTNIPSSAGISPNRWLIVFPQLNPPAANTISQTYEVFAWRIVANVYQLDITGPHVYPTSNGVSLTDPFAGATFVLDGRRLRGMNGTGIAALNNITSAKLTTLGQPGNNLAGQYANFRVSRGLLDPSYDIDTAIANLSTLSGSFNPSNALFNANAVGLDEDYDAPDLENWFLAVQSADGDVFVPSFHRPGILTAADWSLDIDDPTLTADQRRLAYRAMSKILRPRAVDHPAAGTKTFPDLVPDPVSGRINYDVDNDGDGITDSVWLDLGYKPIRSPDGRLFKPLFSFMVLGLNGRIPLNTAGNLNARHAEDDPNTVGVETGMPLFDHISHLGYSTSEVNPKYALQSTYGGTPPVPGTADNTQSTQQFDNYTYIDAAGVPQPIGIPVDLTQLRNLLTGVRRHSPATATFGDQNTIIIDGVTYPFPNSVADAADVNSGQTIPRATQAVAGRWGEETGIPTSLTLPDPALPPGLVNPLVDRGIFFHSVPDPRVDGSGNPLNPLLAAPMPIRAGRSPFPQGQYLVDGIDENYDTLDFYPPFAVDNGPEFADYFDFKGARQLASERIRRYVTPIDPSGNGRLMRFNGLPDMFSPNPGKSPFGIGPDIVGRIGFLHYFRPPGVSTPDIISTTAAPTYTFPIQSTELNVTRGYESLRQPVGAAAPVMGAMPYDFSNLGDTDGDGFLDPPTEVIKSNTSYVGTFTQSINSSFGAFNPADLSLVLPRNGYPFGGLQYNDPDELNLYSASTVLDQPFGISDLEYLYRGQDIDGSALTSRLSELAPVSFEYSPDKYTNRRKFTTETWDTNNFSFAHDNPFGVNVPPPLGLGASVSTVATPGQRQINARFTNDVPASLNTLSAPTPTIAQGDHRINLNFPLPHSYDPFEPIRRKWITETYALLKNTLPPQSLDTPQELARLGQFVVNIIDFRDPDNAITIWQNPDVRQVPARILDVDGDGTPETPRPPSIHLAYRSDGTVDPLYTDARATALVHHGMEYLPVAINEVLGFQFNFANPTAATAGNNNVRANRLFIELVNTLTDSGTTVLPNPSDLGLAGWDFVLVREDTRTAFNSAEAYFHPTFTRPDPTTGQIPPVDPALVPPIVPDSSTDDPTTYMTTLKQTGPVVIATGNRLDPSDGIANDYYDTAVTPIVPRELASRVRAIAENGGAREHVFGGLRTDGVAPPADKDYLQENLPDNPDTDYDTVGTHDPVTDPWHLIPDFNDPAFTAPPPPGVDPDQGMYFWLYLRRPANPLVPPDPNTNPMVVVDSMRFPFSISDGTGQTIEPSAGMLEERPDQRQTQPIYSIERQQPFRGGQLVPSPYITTDPMAPISPLFIYGTSEQASPTNNGPNEGRTFYNRQSGTNDNNGNADMTVEGGTDDPVITTDDIRNSLNNPNSSEIWDYFPFNDRDFMSPAELMLVPATPPGMFTKFFAEDAAPIPFPAPRIPRDPDSDGTFEEAGAFYDTPPPGDGGTSESAKYTYVPDGDLDNDGTPDRDQDFNGDGLPDLGNGVTRSLPLDQVRNYPYLPHEFWYASDPASLVDAANGLPHVVGGPANAGWHRMFEFFEVPTPTLGSIGPVAQGVNFDWYRESQRPGQINLNLVVDDEVFFGLVDDPRMLDFTNATGNFIPAAETPTIVTQVDFNGSPVQGYHMTRRDDPTRTNGFTLFTDGTNVVGNPTAQNIPLTGMKEVFSDFLKQRHGGSGFMYAYGNGGTGTPFHDPTATIVNNYAVARDRPYRSLAYFDIHSTLMRPATLEPTVWTFPPVHTGPLPAPGTPIALDPGQRNPLLEPGFAYFPTDLPAEINSGSRPVNEFLNEVFASGALTTGNPIVPSLPPRRLFQVPDSRRRVDVNDLYSSRPDNAGPGGDPRINRPLTALNPVNDFNTFAAAQTPPLLASIPATGSAIDPQPLTDTPRGTPTAHMSLFPSPTAPATFVTPTPPPPPPPLPAPQPLPPIPSFTPAFPTGDPYDAFLGGSNPGATTYHPHHDMRRHPYYRTEMLQKMMNLTTVRTHQYAVWLTVGYFEVVKPGDPTKLIPDELGPEIGAASGGSTRYRMFAILDRSRATGYDPFNPGDHRDVVVYSRRIE